MGPSLSFRPTKEIVKKAPRSPVKHTTKLPHISSFVNDVPKMPRLSDSVNNLESEAIVTLTAMNECRPLYENSKKFKAPISSTRGLKSINPWWFDWFYNHSRVAT